MARRDELRLMAKIARLYYEHGLRQAEIATQLDLSQASVSRLLKRAHSEQIVRISISVPPGAYTAEEEALQAAYGLKEAIVVELVDDDEAMQRVLGAAAAYYLVNTLKSGDVLGISSWSATLLAMVDAMHPLPRSVSAQVVQILGGMGNPGAETHATHLTRRLASLTNGEATFLTAPGLAASAGMTRAYQDDPSIQHTIACFEQITVALVGIGALEPSRLLASSGNSFRADELELLRQRGTVGDICLRFFDQHGTPVRTALDERVIGMRLEQLRAIPRSIGIAGGRRKLRAIQGALAGGWINVLITDLATAQALVSV